LDNLLEIKLKAVEAQQLVTLEGKITDPGPDWSGWLAGNCEGNIPINEKLLQAFDLLHPRLARSLRNFRATGYVNGTGRVERLSGDSVAKKQFDINLQQATVRHKHFDYPIYNVNGLVVVKNDETRFQSISGRNNNGRINCDGSWTPSHGLQLRFLANDVLLNEELRLAMPTNLQRTWLGLRPSGTVDLVDMDLHTPPGSPRPIIGASVEVTANREFPSSVSVNPVWFPYEVRQVTGKFHFENQRIEVRDFAGVNGKTSVRANGRGSYNDTDWRIRFSDIFASNIQLDESLRIALPQAINHGLDRTRFAGNLVMQGAVELMGKFSQANATENFQPASTMNLANSKRSQPNAIIDWDLKLGMAQASANIGLPINNASGMIDFQGRYSASRVNCTGTMRIDSMMYRDIQITSLVAPFSIDNDVFGFGALSRSSGQQGTAPASATARIFGGYLECDGQLEFDGEGGYFVQAALTDGSLSEFATETAMQHHDFSGRAYAGIQLRGNASGSHSTRGNGNISLRDARIYEVPVILALLNVLRIKEPDRTAFDQGEMKFTVNGENIDFQKIELNGDALSLIGKGTVNLDSAVDLDFYTTMGRNRWFIPVLTKLYHASSKQVWWVEVDGSLAAPKTKHQVLPGLNESLKKLFPEFAEDGS